MLPAPPQFEYRAWAEEAFPGLPAPDPGEPFEEETYILPLGLPGRNIKVRGDALEIKDLLLERDGLQLWDPAVRLEFPIPTQRLERELVVRLALNVGLARERYGRDELLAEVGARRNVALVTVRKRRRLHEAAGCRAEVAEVEIAGRRLHTAAAEHADEARLRRAVAELGLDRHPNVDYPAALARLVPPPRAA